MCQQLNVDATATVADGGSASSATQTAAIGNDNGFIIIPTDPTAIFLVVLPCRILLQLKC